MQTHDDDSHRGPSSDILEALRDKAQRMIAGRASEITAGRHDEVPLREWTYGDVVVRQMPPDEHGVLRISVGGWPGPAYCVFRGDPDHCLELLHRAYLAMTNADPEDTDAAES